MGLSPVLTAVACYGTRCVIILHVIIGLTILQGLSNGGIFVHFYNHCHKASITMPAVTHLPLPDQVANLLLALIYIGHIKAGDKLPPERVLAQQLEVDRTSLRSAIRTLISMNLVRSVQGSGITVLDYQDNGELNFSERLCQIDELEMSRDWIRAAFEFKMTFVPIYLHAIPDVVKSAQGEEVLALVAQQLSQAKAGASPHELAKIEVKLQKLLARTSGNPFVMLHTNTMHNLNIRLMTILYESVNAKSYLKLQSEIFIEYLSGKTNSQQMEASMLMLFKKHEKNINKRIDKLPKKAQLISSPLKHKPKMLSLG